MAKFFWNIIKVNVGRVIGTNNELLIVVPTTTDNFAPVKLATNGAPNPVEIPANKKTAKDMLGYTKLNSAKKNNGNIINFKQVNNNKNFGFEKKFKRSLKFNFKRFKNSNMANINNRLCDNNLPIDGNIIPRLIVTGKEMNKIVVICVVIIHSFFELTILLKLLHIEI